jgi:hypothetical protein
VAFLLARSLAADWGEHRLGQHLHALKAEVERDGWRFVAFVRLVPVCPFYALGLTRRARMAGHLARGWALAGTTSGCTVPSRRHLPAYAVRRAMRTPVRLPCWPRASM